MRSRENTGVRVAGGSLEAVRDAALKALEARGLRVTSGSNGKGPDRSGVTVTGSKDIQARFRGAPLEIGNVALGEGYMEEVGEDGLRYTMTLTVEVNKKWNEADWESTDPRAVVVRCDGGYYRPDAVTNVPVREHEVGRRTLKAVEDAILQSVTGSSAP